MLMNIKTINSRIRRGDNTYSTQQLISRAAQLGQLTEGGYIKERAAEDYLFDKALEEYEQNFFEEKSNEYFNIEKDIFSLLMEYVIPSELYQEMRNSSNEQVFAEHIIDKIAEFSTFSEDYQEEIREYLYNMWY